MTEHADYEYQYEFLLRSKRQATVRLTVRNTCQNDIANIRLKKITRAGVNLSIVGTEKISLLKTGEVAELETDVLLPGNLPDVFFDKTNSQIVLEGHKLIDKSDYEALPEWV
jgi:hypothetical protein